MLNTVSERTSVTDHANQPAKPFIEQLRLALGEPQWRQLHPDIVNRFVVKGRSGTLRYIGVMHQVYCSWLGKLFARILKPLQLLPERCARDVRFDFVIKRLGDHLLKQRRYYLEPGKPFTFRSRFDHRPLLHEEFRAGVGMRLELAVRHNDLVFRDRGYFWRIRNWRIPLPSWLAIGRFELLHRNMDANRFAVIIRIAHPLLGVLFYQRGVFQKI